MQLAIHQLLDGFVAKKLSRVPLRLILIVPFVLQLVGTVGLVGYLSFKNGQQTTQDLANQLMDEASDRTQQHLESYTALAQNLVQLVSDDLELGSINLEPQNLQRLDAYFLKRAQAFKSASFIYVGNEQGKFIGAGPTRRNGRLSYIVEVTDGTTDGHYVSYAVDAQGNRTQKLNAVPQYDPRRRPWYQAAARARQATWSDIYAFIGEANEGLTITAVKPFYQRSGDLAGVTAVDLYLNDISHFLQRLGVSRSGQVFIVEPNGLLVASSGQYPIYQSQQKQLKRLPATASADPLIQATAQHLEARFGPLNQIKQNHQLKFSTQGQQQFVQVAPWRDRFGLNWLVVVVVPEADVMGHIYANTRTTILLCIDALIVAVAIGIVTSRWILLPILRLNLAAKALTRGEWQKPIAIERSDELGELARSFNQMAAQLQRSFTNMQDLNQALLEGEQRLSRILEVLPIGVCVIQQDGTYAYLNQRGQELLGMGVIPDLPLEEIAVTYQIYRAGTNQIYPNEDIPVMQALQGKQSSVSDMEIRRHGQVIALEVRATPIFDDQNQVQYAIATFEDISDRKQAEHLAANYNRMLEQQVYERTLALEQEITERKQIEAALRENQYFLQKIADATPAILYLFDLSNGRTVYLNQKSITVLGYSPEEICQGGPQWLFEHFHPDDRHLCENVVDRFMTLSDDSVISTEYRFRHRNGEWHWLNTREVVFSRSADGSPTQILGSVQDITDQKRVEETLKIVNLELERLATSDSLTQVANRRQFDRHLNQEWQRLSREQQPLSLILCDVDYFKAYNDHYGHQGGDDCLIRVARAISRVTKRATDLVARYGGEEFAVILPNTEAQGAVTVAQAIQAEIQQLQLPHAQSQVSEIITLSLGIACLVPNSAFVTQSIIVAADQALYEAKKLGRDRYCISPLRLPPNPLSPLDSPVNSITTHVDSL